VSTTEFLAYFVISYIVSLKILFHEFIPEVRYKISTVEKWEMCKWLKIMGFSTLFVSDFKRIWRVRLNVLCKLSPSWNGKCQILFYLQFCLNLPGDIKFWVRLQSLIIFSLTKKVNCGNIYQPRLCAELCSLSANGSRFGRPCQIHHNLMKQ
jgi:hypothetical protein